MNANGSSSAGGDDRRRRQRLQKKNSLTALKECGRAMFLSRLWNSLLRTSKSYKRWRCDCSLILVEVALAIAAINGGSNFCDKRLTVGLINYVSGLWEGINWVNWLATWYLGYRLCYGKGPLQRCYQHIYNLVTCIFLLSLIDDLLFLIFHGAFNWDTLIKYCSPILYINLVFLGNKQKEEEFIFNDVPERPVPSILRGYSAPVRLESDLTEADLFILLANDSDEFNRWESGQVLARKLMLSLVSDFQRNKPLVLNPQFVHGLRTILGDSSLDKEFIAKALTLPGEGEIMDMMEVADPDAVHAVRTFIKKQLASELKQEFLDTVKNNRSSEQYVFNHPNMARRALKNIALAYLGSLGDREVTELALHEYRTAKNMTEQFAALVALDQNPGKTQDDVLADFYSKWKHDFLVASRMVSAFSRWKRFDETRQNLAKAQLEMILSANGLSENVYEIASKSLAA
ncbi:puromycin-sensitive aminopeptidase-like isoform X4 [Olea europaea subsp. europaea]|nr:puromycin-sensitive aminopeptidase-like isoform X4 [Olea europaea subsp. europaea]